MERSLFVTHLEATLGCFTVRVTARAALTGAGVLRAANLLLTTITEGEGLETPFKIPPVVLVRRIGLVCSPRKKICVPRV